VVLAGWELEEAGLVELELEEAAELACVEAGE